MEATEERKEHGPEERKAIKSYVREHSFDIDRELNTPLIPVQQRRAQKQLEGVRVPYRKIHDDLLSTSKYHVEVRGRHFILIQPGHLERINLTWSEVDNKWLIMFPRKNRRLTTNHYVPSAKSDRDVVMVYQKTKLMRLRKELMKRTIWDYIANQNFMEVNENNPEATKKSFIKARGDEIMKLGGGRK